VPPSFAGRLPSGFSPVFYFDSAPLFPISIFLWPGCSRFFPMQGPLVPPAKAKGSPFLFGGFWRCPDFFAASPGPLLLPGGGPGAARSLFFFFCDLFLARRRRPRRTPHARLTPDVLESPFEITPFDLARTFSNSPPHPPSHQLIFLLPTLLHGFCFLTLPLFFFRPRRCYFTAPQRPLWEFLLSHRYFPCGSLTW